jgi:DNA-binding NarL/FixJ family response regulator
VGAVEWMRGRWAPGLVGAAAVALLLTLEVVTDENGVTPAELLLEVLELALTVTAAVGAALLVERLQSQHQEKLALLRDLEAARGEGEAWRREVQTHLAGLGSAIEKQLDQWKLTAAEADVALLILKGFSHKEIAALRSTSEATVRQQAGMIYKKSGMHGRAPFCAYFLEDLLPPRAVAR